MNTTLKLGRLSFSFPLVMLMLGGLMLFLFSADAFAASSGSAQGLPWEGPIEKLRNSLSGPVAFAIALLGIVVCGAMLIWGGEISEFVRRIIMLVLVVSVIVFANSLLTGQLFSGATVPDAAELADALRAMTAQAAPAAPAPGR